MPIHRMFAKEPTALETGENTTLIDTDSLGSKPNQWLEVTGQIMIPTL